MNEVIIMTDFLIIKLGNKQYEIRIKEDSIVIYAEEGINIIEESKLKNWIKIQ